MGNIYEIVQREGGEQGDPPVPLLSGLGQHSALMAVNEHLIEGESLLAFLDDVYVLCSPQKVGEVHKVMQHELQSRANIRVYHRISVEATRVRRVDRSVKENATVWVGDQGLSFGRARDASGWGRRLDSSSANDTASLPWESGFAECVPFAARSPRPSSMFRPQPCANRGSQASFTFSLVLSDDGTARAVWMADAPTKL